VPGLYTIAATYSGDATFAASGSTPVTVTIPRATPTVVLSSSKTSLKMGERFNLVTNVTDMRSSTFPEETVQYYDSINGSAAQPLGLPRVLTLGPNHSAVSMIDSYSVVLPQGTHVLTVQFLENWEFNSVTSAPITVDVAVPPDFTISPTSALPAI